MILLLLLLLIQVTSQVTASLNPTESKSLQVSEYFTDWVNLVCNNSTSAIDNTPGVRR
jgi:hypothetical protein